MEIDTTTIAEDTPLRPALAAKVAFPDGSINERSIRNPIRSGALNYETINNKKFVTLRNIAEMRANSRRHA